MYISIIDYIMYDMEIHLPHDKLIPGVIPIAKGPLRYVHK